MSTLKTNNIQHVDRSDPSIIINTDGSVNIAGTMTYEDVTNVDAVGIITGRDNINAQKQVHVGTGVSVKAGGLNVTAGITTVQALQATTISGTTVTIGDLYISENIVHRGDDNTRIRFPAADTIVAETGGTERIRINSDGRIAINDTGFAAYSSFSPCLAIGDSGDSQPGLVVRGSTSSNCDISFCDNSGAEGDEGVSEGLIRYEHSNDALAFHTADAERLRITSSGDVGIGYDSPTVKLHIREAASGFSGTYDNRYHCILEDDAEAYLGFYLPNDGYGGLRFNDTTGLEGYLDYYFASDEFHYSSSGSHRFFTAGSERIRVHSGGTVNVPSGITLGSAVSSTAAANTLDDYEEGTWTPNIQGSGSNNSKTYSYQTGLYTKVGNKVTARFRIKWTSYTSDSGNAIVNGLPFTANDASVSTGSFAGNNLNFPSSNHVTSALEVENGDTYMYILNTYDNAVWINSQASTFWQSTGEIRGEMTYFTNS